MIASELMFTLKKTSSCSITITIKNKFVQYLSILSYHILSLKFVEYLIEHEGECVNKNVIGFLGLYLLDVIYSESERYHVVKYEVCSMRPLS
jgi:hypothetical protein